MIFIGIDPGLRSGAIGAIDHNGAFVYCADVAADGERINVRRLKDQLLYCIPVGDVAEIVIEDVFVMPGQGSSSTDKFMRAAGAMEAVCLLTATTHVVRPQKWKKEMALTSEKQDSLDMARAMWPDADLKLKKHHGKAEALLIAEWLRRQFA